MVPSVKVIGSEEPSVMIILGSRDCSEDPHIVKNWSVTLNSMCELSPLGIGLKD